MNSMRNERGLNWPQWFLKTLFQKQFLQFHTLLFFISGPLTIMCYFSTSFWNCLKQSQKYTRCRYTEPMPMQHYKLCGETNIRNKRKAIDDKKETPKIYERYTKSKTNIFWDKKAIDKEQARIVRRRGRKYNVWWK